MKKTLVALSVAAFAASSAQAVTVLDTDQTKVDFDGSLRLILEKANTKKTTVATNKSEKTRGSALRNAGSRFGVKVKHNLGEDFYALGRLEFRFDKKFITNCFYCVFLINKFTSLPIDSMESFCDYFHAKDIYPNLRN